MKIYGESLGDSCHDESSQREIEPLPGASIWRFEGISQNSSLRHWLQQRGVGGQGLYRVVFKLLDNEDNGLKHDPAFQSEEREAEHADDGHLEVANFFQTSKEG